MKYDLEVVVVLSGEPAQRTSYSATRELSGTSRVTSVRLHFQETLIGAAVIDSFRLRERNRDH